jgi:serine/threonine protein kinase
MVWQAGHSLYSDRYRIERVLGQGGFGIAYLAHDRQGRRVVIKTLRDEILIDHKNKYFCDRFKDEALKLAVCRHPHIVAVQNTFTESYSLRLEGQSSTLEAFCLVMEYIEGESIEQIVHRRGAIPEGELARYIHQIGSALEFVHDLGVLHRDIKPSNILIRSVTAEAVLIDFGLARNFIRDTEKNYTVAVTHGFAPPEQYSRKIVATEAVDVYALAATAYYALTGKMPVSAMDRMLATPQPTAKELKPHISQTINDAIVKGMALRVEDRINSMAEWLKLLPTCTPLQMENTLSEVNSTLPTINYDNPPIVPQPVLQLPKIVRPEPKDKLSSELNSKPSPSINTPLKRPALPQPTDSIKDPKQATKDSLLLEKIDPDLLGEDGVIIYTQGEENICNGADSFIQQEIEEEADLSALDFDSYNPDLTDRRAIVQKQLLMPELDPDLTTFSKPSSPSTLIFEAIDPDLTADPAPAHTNSEAWDEAIYLLHMQDAPSLLRLKKIMIAVCTGKFPSDTDNPDKADITALLRQIIRKYPDFNSFQRRVDYFILNLTKPLIYAVVADTLLRVAEPLFDTA